jgi:hypothetical protein
VTEIRRRTPSSPVMQNVSCAARCSWSAMTSGMRSGGKGAPSSPVVWNAELHVAWSISPTSS